MATFSDGEREVLLLPLLSGVCVCSFRPVYPADPDCVDTSKPGRSRQLPHLDRLSDKSVEMRPNLFFINFNRSGDCLFVFLRYIFLGLFSFLWLEFGHYNQKTGPFSSALSQNVRNFPDVIFQLPSIQPQKQL